MDLNWVSKDFEILSVTNQQRNHTFFMDLKWILIDSSSNTSHDCPRAGEVTPWREEMIYL